MFIASAFLTLTHFDFKIMKTIKLLFLFGALLIAGCDFNGDNSLFNDDNLTSDPDPTVTSITPSVNPPFAGIDELTIVGTNFSTEATRNLVYVTFYLPAVNDAGAIQYGTDGKALRGKVRDAVKATVISASATQLRVKTPARPSFDVADPKTRPLENVDVRVAVLGAENFSTTKALDLLPVYEPFPKTTFDAKTEEPYGMTRDAQNNFFISLFKAGSSDGVWKVTPTGERTQFLTPANVQNFKLDDLAYKDAEAYLYGVRGLRAIFRFKQNGAQETFVAIPTTNETAKLVTLVFDSKGILWTGGNNKYIYRVLADKTVKSYAFEADVRALRAANGYLYVLAKRTGVWGVWRFAINATTNDLGTEETVGTMELGANEAFSMALATNGDVIVGTNRTPDPIMVISGGQTSTLYAGILTGMVRSMVWGANPTLYVGQGTLPTGTSSAISPALYTLNTRRSGAY